jgi:integrase
MATRRGFGRARKLSSGRWQAFYGDPDGRTRISRTGNPTPVRHTAPHTFDSREDAEAWLTDERRLVSAGAWTPPRDRREARRTQALSFGEYAEAWLPARKVKGRALADRTLDQYRWLLDRFILPTFGDAPLRSITSDQVDDWYEVTAIAKPTTQAQAYSLLRTILGTAVDRGLISSANPAKIRGGGSTKRAKKIRPASLDELETIVKELPERFRLMALLATWCALRFGELAELRRGDVDMRTGVLHVRRGVVRTKGRTIVKAPKSEAGVRDVAIPPHLLPLVAEHMLQHAESGKDGLLFPAAGGGHLAPASLSRVYYPARAAAGRPDLRFHDLRHTGAVFAAQSGATLAELMGRLGHSTPGAALRYQHAAEGRDLEIARRLSGLADARET